MFLLWLIPLAIVLGVLPWFLFVRVRHRVASGERQHGRIIED